MKQNSVWMSMMSLFITLPILALLYWGDSPQVALALKWTWAIVALSWLGVFSEGLTAPDLFEVVLGVTKFAVGFVLMWALWHFQGFADYQLYAFGASLLATAFQRTP